MSEQAKLPLNALRAFEAVAAHLSFTDAARSLNVTTAAVLLYRLFALLVPAALGAPAFVLLRRYYAGNEGHADEAVVSELAGR